MKMEQSVPKRRHIKFRRRGITQKKAYNIQNVFYMTKLRVAFSNFANAPKNVKVRERYTIQCVLQHQYFYFILQNTTFKPVGVILKQLCCARQGIVILLWDHIKTIFPPRTQYCV